MAWAPNTLRGFTLTGFLILCIAITSSAESNNTEDSLSEGINCGDGLIVPIWRPYDNLSFGDRLGRGILYTLFMVYLFIGVSIVSDRFMESIEMITAQEKEVTIKDQKTGRNQVVIVKVRITSFDLKILNSKYILQIIIFLESFIDECKNILSKLL